VPHACLVCPGGAPDARDGGAPPNVTPQVTRRRACPRTPDGNHTHGARLGHPAWATQCVPPRTGDRCGVRRAPASEPTYGAWVGATRWPGPAQAEVQHADACLRDPRAGCDKTRKSAGGTRRDAWEGTQPGVVNARCSSLRTNMPLEVPERAWRLARGCRARGRRPSGGTVPPPRGTAARALPPRPPDGGVRRKVTRVRSPA
jgi:hypothetical protein